jgi:Fe-S cluster assembly iron-binding protein IscA
MVITENRPVTMTEGAIKQIKSLMAQEGFDTTQKLRVGVKGGGCSGMSIFLDLIIRLKKIKHLRSKGSVVL